jgi:Flp pilus assembly protein CpaB
VRRPRRPRDPLTLARRLAALVLLGLAGALAVRPAPGAAAGTPPPPAVVPVVVATHDLAAGRALAGADVERRDVAPGAVPDGAATDPAALVGRVLAGALRRGEAVTDVRLVGPGLATGLPGGEVAAPVRLADLAVTALVHAGDRVDVLASTEGAPRAEVVAPAALVLAVPDTGSDGPAGARAGLLLLAVDPPVAERLAAAAAAATLTVTLHGAGP